MCGFNGGKREVLYLAKLLEPMGFAQASPTPVCQDKTACIEWGDNVIGGRERGKHMDIRRHLGHEVIRQQQRPARCTRDGGESSSSQPAPYFSTLIFFIMPCITCRTRARGPPGGGGDGSL